MDKELPVSAWPEWKIIEKIGEGSFGKVYKAQRTERGKSFYSAIKIINIPGSQSELNSVRSETGDDQSARQYFQNLVEECIQEISTMEYFRGNSYIVSVEDFKVMEYLDAIGWEISIRMEYLTSFMDYCAEKQLTEKEVIKLGMDLSKALEYCRKLKIIHRDIKPENIFVSRFGDFKLGDFGIARELERTMSGFSKKGTYSYMAPEMYKGEKYDSRVDIYSLGIVLYRLMNHNRLPFMSLEKQFITYRDKENALNKRVAGEQMGIPADAGEQFARIILKACAYDPAQRYQTPEELYGALDDLKNGRAVRSRQLSNGVQKTGTGKTKSYSATVQNIASDAGNVRKSTAQNMSAQNTSAKNTQENRKTSDFQNAAKRKRAVNNVPVSSFTDKETMSVVTEQKIQPQETPSETVAIRSARAVEARKRRRRKKQLLRRTLLAIVAGTAILLTAVIYYRVSTDNTQEEQEDNPIAILENEKYSTTKSDSKDFSQALDTIKEQATTITNNLDSYDWVGTEGTVLRYLKRVKTTQQADGNLDIESECMKALVYPAESEDKVYEEYFYWGEKLFFAYIWYDETSEYYYYDDGELIRWIDSNGKCHDNETDNEEFVKRGEKYWNNSLKALKGEGTKNNNDNVSD
ncbi:serine/threonine protein kinase [Blautia wexlerae]|uniref:serine/threonine-protein kinase n=1 Tax=Blautia wexlerae TaxID=418240 RepID=UPI0015706A62|nr:serine/threonine-protein kinase [Blautia wexlerae]NSE04110.1 serine/threonine protein kinase [Blautia wexlerae]NSF77220.1 serine/threonine protein kinase [Blautia wexlerae]